MIKLEKENLSLSQEFFKEIKFYMTKTATQGYMGKVFVDNTQKPEIAMVLLGRFCFIDGNSRNQNAKQVLLDLDDYYKTIIANENWYEIIEEVFKDKYEIDKRFSIKKDTKFEEDKLKELSLIVGDKYKIEKIDENNYKQIKETNSFSCNITMSDNFERYGIGFCAKKENGEIVAVIVSNGIYDDGIEINIKIDEEDRHNGLGTALGANMILECLSQINILVGMLQILNL